MLKTVILAENPLEPETWERFEVEDVRDFCMARFSEWPGTARIYHEYVAENCDVTPSDEWGIERLGELEGTIYIIVYPGDPISIIIAIVAVAAVAAAAFLLKPSVPNVALRNTQSTSPNNELSDRQNSPRVGGRIPDIFGTVRSTPDLLAVPYKVFVNNEEVEYSYMCVGRGEYSIADVRDDTTRVVDIAGSSVEIYAPFTSPQSGDDPQLRIGSAINEPLYNVTRNSAVNGQVLRAPNANSVSGNNNIRFNAPDEIEATGEIDFTSFFASGDIITVTNAGFTGTVSGSGVNVNRSVRFTDSGDIEFETTTTAVFSVGDTLYINDAFFTNNAGQVLNLSGAYVIQGKTSTVITLQSPETINSNWNLILGQFTGDKTPYRTVNLVVPAGTIGIDLSGTYTLTSVAAKKLTLSNPSIVNASWNTLADFAGSQTSYISPIIATSGNKFVGPFILDSASLSHVFANFVALNGLYLDDGKQQYRFDVTVAMGVTPINSSDEAIGGEQIFYAFLEGSATLRSTRAQTIKGDTYFTGRCRVRAWRVTDANLSFEGSVIDEVKWRDLYAVSNVTATQFGNVTTVQSVTFATSGALAVKDRKLNMLVTRRIPLRLSGTTFTVNKFATNRVDDIIAFICRDPYIGNRGNSEIDFDNIYGTIDDIEDYFGIEDAVNFCYTFDQDNFSFEETMAAIASAVYAKAYRRGNVIKLSFERETQDSTLLFNHRNKIPGSEQRTVRFGYQDDNDGIEYEYVDPADDALVTFYLPLDRSAVNPKKIETVGVRSRYQAYFHAWRIWNKLRYQSIATEFEATQEAELLVLQDRILVADNTRSGTQDGEVKSQTGLSLKLSQAYKFTPGVSYSIFLQHTDGTIESIGVTATSDPYTLVLAHAPKAPLALADDLYARTTYVIVGNNNSREQAFLATEKTPQSNFTAQIRAVNYDARYYDHDKSYINGAMDW